MNFIPLNGWPQLKDIPEKLEHFREVYARFAKVNKWYQSIEETELTGNPVIFEKALKLNATALRLNMLPIQSGSGDPSPENVRPISGRTEVNLGRTGKNLLPMTLTGLKAINTTGTWADNVYTINNTTYTVLTDSADRVLSIKVNGTPNNIAQLFLLRSDLAFSAETLLSSGIAFNNSAFVQGRSGASGSYIYYNADINGVSVPANTALNQIYIAVMSEKTADNVVIYPMLRDASISDNTYEPYTPVTLTIALGTTVYGGTLDVKTGVLTVTHKYYLIDAFGSKSSSTDVDQYLYTVTEAKSGTIPICSKCLGVDAAHIFDPTITAPVCGFAATTPNVFRFSLPTSMEINTLEKVNEYIGDGLQICYELATPTTIQLTGAELALLMGYNRISTDADSLTVKAYTI